MGSKLGGEFGVCSPVPRFPSINSTYQVMLPTTDEPFTIASASSSKLPTVTLTDKARNYVKSSITERLRNLTVFPVASNNNFSVGLTYQYGTPPPAFWARKKQPHLPVTCANPGLGPGGAGFKTARTLRYIGHACRALVCGDPTPNPNDPIFRSPGAGPSGRPETLYACKASMAPALRPPVVCPVRRSIIG
jgi:hypothetical protein